MHPNDSSQNGGNSVSDRDVFSVAAGPLTTEVVETPFDYSLTLGVRKIARFGYENRANVFYDGTEKTYGDAATVGKYDGFEFLAEADWRRQQGKNFLDQDYFARYVADSWVIKAEYLQDGFADVRYFEASERLPDGCSMVVESFIQVADLLGKLCQLADTYELKNLELAM